MLELIKREPVVLAVAVRVATFLGARYGFNLSVDEVIAVMLLLELVAGYFTRKRVSPVE